MLTQDDAQKRAEELGAELMRLSYNDLVDLRHAQCENSDTLCRFEDHPKGELYVDVGIGKLGRMRKRISVEITVTGDGWEKWDQPGCVYFERFASGKLYWFTTSAWQALLFYIFIFIGVVIILLSIIWLIARLL